jgi:hypothetical protein
LVRDQHDKSYIDELKKSLYSRTVPEVQTRRKLRIEEEPTDIKTDWEHPKEPSEESVVLNTKYKDKSMSFFTKLFIFSLIFCIVVVGIGAYLFFNGTNLISGDNIDIKISGPVSIPGGEPVSFDVIATNNNNIELELVDMSIDFPDGTVDPHDSSKVLNNYRKLLGNIPAGGSARESVTAIIFGEENLQKQIEVKLTYNLKGSTSVFNKTKSYDVILKSSPLNVTVSTIKEITSGQEFDIKVELTSNSKQTLKGVIFESKYPFGFKYLSSTLNPLIDNSTWIIGDIPAGGKRAFTIRGSLVGEDEDLRVFRFNVGVKDRINPNKIGTQYLSIQQDVFIQKPFIALDIEVDGNKDPEDYIGQYGKTARVEINWFNNLPTIVSNMKIRVDLSGTAYDKSTVLPDKGYFDSASNSIVWSQQTNSEFSSIAPGESGTVSFTIVPRSIGRQTVNPLVSVTANVLGNRTQETNVPVTVTASTKRDILISSSVDLSGRIVRTLAPIQNTGPIPPVVDQATTYTVVWSINNTSNPIRDVEVKATLPPYVKWLNNVSPNEEEVIYDENSGLVTWNVGNVDANTTAVSNRKEVMFQISFTPSIVHLGNSPNLVNRSSLDARDSFTGVKLTSDQDPMTTRFGTDPSYRQDDEKVIR